VEKGSGRHRSDEDREAFERKVLFLTTAHWVCPQDLQGRRRRRLLPVQNSRSGVCLPALRAGGSPAIAPGPRSSQSQVPQGLAVDHWACSAGGRIQSPLRCAPERSYGNDRTIYGVEAPPIPLPDPLGRRGSLLRSPTRHRCSESHPIHPCNRIEWASRDQRVTQWPMGSSKECG